MDDAPPLKVLRYDRGRFLVRSQRPHCSNWYVVELRDPDFPMGRCCCIGYDVYVEARLNREMRPAMPSCIHIKAVRAELDRARTLCEAAGLEFMECIIPSA